MSVKAGHLRPRISPRQSRLVAIRRLVLGVSLLAGATAAATSSPLFKPPDRITVDRRNSVLELSWSDTEERLQGAIQPDVPRAGEPLRILLNVGSFEGAPFEGPITITLREQGATHGQVQTVKKGAVNWRAEFIPERPGPHQIDVSFRTTRLKVLHANLAVEPRPVPRFVLWTMVGLAATVALGLGLRTLVRKDTSLTPHPAWPEPPAVSPPLPTSAQASPPASASQAPAPDPSRPPEKPSAL